MTIGAVGTGWPIWSSVGGVPSSAHIFTKCSVGPSSSAMIRPWKPGFSKRSQLKKKRTASLRYQKSDNVLVYGSLKETINSLEDCAIRYMLTGTKRNTENKWKGSRRKALKHSQCKSAKCRHTAWIVIYIILYKQVLGNYIYDHQHSYYTCRFTKDPYHPLITLTEMTGESLNAVASSRSQ